MQPINAYLFRVLTQVFGGPPHVSRAGEPFEYDVVNTPRGPRMRARGEQYHVCCPDCGDTRHRLYFNHRFGTTISDPRFPGPLTNLSYCQNEQKPKSKWFKMLGDALNDPQVLLAIQQQSAHAQTQVPLEERVVPMGEVIPLRELPADHQAITYLRGRGYEINYLNDYYGACLSVSHPDEKVERMAVGRVLFPFTVDGNLRSWQGRLTYELPEKVKFPPKWYFPSGFKTLWGYDVARHYRVVIINEGILSAVNFGPAAVSVGGKTLTYRIKQLLISTWEYVVVALDPGAGILRAPGEIDYQQRMVDELRAEGMKAVGIGWTHGDKRDAGNLGPRACLQTLRDSCPLAAQLLPYIGG